MGAPRKWRYRLSYRLPTAFGGGRWSEVVVGLKAAKARAKEVKAKGATAIRISNGFLA